MEFHLNEQSDSLHSLAIHSHHLLLVSEGRSKLVSSGGGLESLIHPCILQVKSETKCNEMPAANVLPHKMQQPSPT